MPACILLDTSSSMNAPVGSRRHIDVLASILTSVLPATPDVWVFAFNSVVTDLQDAVTERGVHLPEPEGSTALHLPIAVSNQQRNDKPFSSNPAAIENARTCRFSWH